MVKKGTVYNTKRLVIISNNSTTLSINMVKEKCCIISTNKSCQNNITSSSDFTYLHSALLQLIPALRTHDNTRATRCPSVRQSSVGLAAIYKIEEWKARKWLDTTSFYLPISLFTTFSFIKSIILTWTVTKYHITHTISSC